MNGINHKAILVNKPDTWFVPTSGGYRAVHATLPPPQGQQWIGKVMAMEQVQKEAAVFERIRGTIPQHVPPAVGVVELTDGDGVLIQQRMSQTTQLIAYVSARCDVDQELVSMTEALDERLGDLSEYLITKNLNELRSKAVEDMNVKLEEVELKEVLAALQLMEPSDHRSQLARYLRRSLDMGRDGTNSILDAAHHNALFDDEVQVWPSLPDLNSMNTNVSRKAFLRVIGRQGQAALIAAITALRTEQYTYNVQANPRTALLDTKAHAITCDRSTAMQFLKPIVEERMQAGAWHGHNTMVDLMVAIVHQVDMMWQKLWDETGLVGRDHNEDILRNVVTAWKELDDIPHDDRAWVRLPDGKIVAFQMMIIDTDRVVEGPREEIAKGYWWKMTYDTPDEVVEFVLRRTSAITLVGQSGGSKPKRTVKAPAASRSRAGTRGTRASPCKRP